MRQTQNSNCGGNVLWFILLAVVLLAGLTMVLSRMGSSVDQDADQEQNIIKASQIIRYGKGLELAIDRLKLSGCSENEISLENDQVSSYANPAAPPDLSCHVFETQGAGQSWRDFNATNLNNANAPVIYSGEIAIDGLGTARPELMILARVSESICAQINRLSDIDDSVAAGLTSGIANWNLYFTGSYGAATHTLGTGSEAPELSDKPAGCLIDDNGARVFYHSLIIR